MIKIKLYEFEKHRNECTFRPFLFAKELFHDIGIEFVTQGKADFAFVGHASFIDKKLSLTDSTNLGINFLKKVNEPFFLFDGQDAPTLIGSYEVFEKSKAICLFKPTLYKNKTEYLNKYVNGRLYWGEGDYNLPNLDSIIKIKLNHTNWLSTIKPKWMNYNSNKNVDVSAMFMYPQKDVFEHGLNQAIYYNKFRKQIFDNLNEKKFTVNKIINGVRIPLEEYYNRMYNSKIILAPFGFGEIAPRDLEAAIFGCVLLKPDMSHLETKPDIYIPNETYIPCKHDFSDINEKIEYILSDYNNIQTRLIENFRRKFIEEYSDEKLVLAFYEIFKNIEGIIT